MTDKYACFAHLAQHEAEGRDYRVHVVERPASPVLIVAPHGGSIEIGTSELARAIAGPEHNLFTFDGLKSAWGANRDLHITSHRFDHPQCLALAARCEVAVGIHGCRGESQIFIGGLDTVLTGLLARHLVAAGLPAVTEGHRYPGRNPQNICNRAARRKGAQLEFTMDLRGPDARAIIAPVVRAALAEYIATLELPLRRAAASLS
ncbi:MAG TPA: poly-gamma-glutamate hydrolase family protein [Steroidobacteraceae bacterium]